MARPIRPAMLRAAAPPLVLAERTTTRSLAGVIAILTFLASLAAGTAAIVAGSSAAWRSSISGEATVQLRPRAGRDIEADLARAAAIARVAPGIAEARALSKAESEALLEPWLGQNLDLGALPVPRIVVLRRAEGSRADLSGLAARLAAEIPGATVDDHGAWVSRLSSMAETVIGFSVLLVLLALAAAGLAVAFATRGVIAGSREVIEVLHLVGAEERFVTAQYAARLFRLALGAALAGGAAAALAFQLLGSFAGPPASDGTDLLTGRIGVGIGGYALIALVALAVAALAGAVSGLTVKRFLRQDGAG